MQYKVDSFVLFLERAAKLLTESGIVGYVVPSTWLNTERFFRLRQFLLKKYAVRKIVNLGKGVFTAANIDTLLIFFGKGRRRGIKVVDTSNFALGESRIENPISKWKARQAEWSLKLNYEFDIFFDLDWSALFNKVKSCAIPLGELTEISQGLIPYNTRKMSEKILTFL